MKYLKASLLTLALTLTTSVLAFEVPKDAVIKVYDKSGKEIGSMNRKDYKVVKVDSSKPKATLVIRKPNKKNRLRYKVGSGYDGVSTSSSGSSVTVKQRLKPVVGVGYDRMISDDLHVGIDVHSNSTTTLSLGMDF